MQLDELVHDVLAAASLPQSEQPVRAPDGVGNHVFLAGDVVVKLGTGSDAAKWPRAAAVMRAARATVRVPEILFEDFTCVTFPVRVMVLARVHGEPLSRAWPRLDDPGRLRALEQVAAELDALHRLSPEALPAAGFATPWWRERVERIERWLVQLRSTATFPTAWFDHIERWFHDHRSALSDVRAACVLHNDVHWGNVLVDGGRVTALLDFDDALAGPAEEDAWGLLFALEESDPPLDLACLSTLPGFELDDPQALTRLRINEVENILELLAGGLTWVSDETAIVDAHETYEYAFASEHFERLLDRVYR